MSAWRDFLKAIVAPFILGPFLTAVLLVMQTGVAAYFWHRHGTPDFYFRSFSAIEFTLVLSGVLGFFIGLAPGLVLFVVNLFLFQTRPIFLSAMLSVLLWAPVAYLLVRHEFATRELLGTFSYFLPIPFGLGPALFLGWWNRRPSCAAMNAGPQPMAGG